MNRELGLKILSQIMAWTDDEARDEFLWLSFMSDYKYDGYRDYVAGARFTENLAAWLQQFSEADRRVAYQFIKQNLIYFSAAEIQRLVGKFVPDIVQRSLVRDVSKRLDIPSYRVFSSKEALNEFKIERRKTLFMALSDGARIDALRRVNAGSISNEQIVIATQIDDSKWKDLLDNLATDVAEISNTNGKDARFNRVYLIDDFTASGTSLLRDPDGNGDFKGKLVKFAKSVLTAKDYMGGNSPFSDSFYVVVHHYIGTEKARENIECALRAASTFLSGHGISSVSSSYGMMLPSEIVVSKSGSDPFSKLCENYYDDAIEGKGKHGGQSGITSKKFGYANCGLPVVLEHNAPNNSLPLLWAETKGLNGNHQMRPLFRRRERHSDMGNG